MTFEDRVEIAFSSRGLPTRLIGRIAPGCYSSDENEALWFANRDWRELTWEDWEGHSDAIFRFTPEAFAYYLPSILIESRKDPDRWLKAADALVIMLENRSTPEKWNKYQASNFEGFKVEEYAVLEEWLLFFRNRNTYNNAYDKERIDEALRGVNSLRGLRG